LADNVFDAADAPPPRFAVVYAPGRRRDRVPEQSVRVVADEAAACREAASQPGHFAAEVIGPLRSSEGLRVYFVRRWL
jgi:hypothetical protein